MTALSAGMTREQAAELLAAHNKDPFHIEHGETVEQTMRYFAREYDSGKRRSSGASWVCCTTSTGKSTTMTR